MTQQFFPPDVSLRLGGNRAQAQTHIGDARALLFKALNTGLNPTALIRNFDDGTTIVVRIAGNQKIVAISSVPMPAPAPAPEPTFEPPELPGPEEVPLMYSGWTRTHSIVSNALREFTPSDACALAYELDQEWQDVEKLYTAPLQVSTITPSQFSGKMKRVVQALLGLGKITDATPAYLTGLSNEDERTINATYSPQWTKTHGIIRAGLQNHWLIEISQANGVLAMPLILIPSTTTQSYYDYMEDLEDTDTIKVLDEFGGLPNGETFPTNTVTLQNYINEGKILRLLTAAQVEPFYKNKGPFSPYLGWAFADTLGEARNTCFSIGRSIRGNAQYVRAEHWALRISLSEHDVSKLELDPPEPIGTGSATLEVVNQGMLSHFCLDKLYVPISESYMKSFALLSGLADYDGVALLGVIGSEYAAAEQNIPVGGDISVFYDGDVLKRFSWVPLVTHVNTRVTTGVGAGAIETTTQALSPAAFVFTGIDMRASNETHIVASPVTGSSGTSNSQDFWGLLPRDTRECALIATIHYTSVYSGWTPAVTTKMFRCTGYFSGLGQTDIPVPVTNQAVFNSTYPVYGYPYDLRPVFSARVSARGTQYVMSSALKILNTDPFPAAMTNITDADLQYIQPYNMNWVGAPD